MDDGPLLMPRVPTSQPTRHARDQSDSQHQCCGRGFGRRSDGDGEVGGGDDTLGGTGGTAEDEKGTRRDLGQGGRSDLYLEEGSVEDLTRSQRGWTIEEEIIVVEGEPGAVETEVGSIDKQQAGARVRQCTGEGQGVSRIAGLVGRIQSKR